MSSSNISTHNSTSGTNTGDCHCATCTHLRTARQAIHAALSTFSLGADESPALDMLVAAIKPLSDAQGILQRVHAPRVSPTKPSHATGPGPKQYDDPIACPKELMEKLRRRAGEMGDSGQHQVSPEHKRQVTNPWDRANGGTMERDGEKGLDEVGRVKTKGFQETVRARAAELGILRGMDGSSEEVGMVS